MNALSYWVGIDVSKQTLDIHIRPTGEVWRQQNNEQGIKQLVDRLQSLQPELVVLEATGGLEVLAAATLSQADIAVAVVNPRQGARFC